MRAAFRAMGAWALSFTIIAAGVGFLLLVACLCTGQDLETEAPE